VQTTFVGNDIILLKSQKHLINTFSYDFQHCPDIAQTLAVACLGLGIDGDFFGLHTLKIKETDRIVALQNEMTKLGAEVSSTEDSLSFKSPLRLHENINIATYNDHRMAMAFAPLALKIPIQIEDANVVEKSYPLFWSHLEALGFRLKRFEIL
jgi:3-phosphoshikimate 1-carboxyvinyltransferase